MLEALPSAASIQAMTAAPAAPATPTTPAAAARQAEAFPRLTAAQIARIEPRGRHRTVQTGEVLGEAGEPVTKIFVVVSGRLDLVRPPRWVGEDVPTFSEGMFTGERSILAGGRFLARIQASTPCEVIEVSRESLLDLIRTDPELSDIFLRAFILRRLQLIDQSFGDVQLLGSNHCQGSLQIREFLTRNGHPYRFVDLDTDADSQAMLDQFHVKAGDIPVVICRGTIVLRNPTIQQVADCLGLNPTIDRTTISDLVIIGAGILIAKTAARIDCDKKPYRVLLGDGEGEPLPTRAIVIASGVEYRRLAVENLSRFEGAGVYYAATRMEAQLCADEEIVVVGGANSAG